MQVQPSSPIKHIIRSKIVTQLYKPINIFTRRIKTQPEQLKLKRQVKSFMVVGDLQFKKKFCQQANNNLNKTISKLSHLQDTNFNTTLNETNIKQEQLRTQIINKANKDPTESQRKAISRFYVGKKKQGKIHSFLMKRLSQHNHMQNRSSICYTKKYVQYIKNPQLADLINQNIPEYWQHSLRDNEKNLKKHILGNPFSIEKAEEMLQTLKGRKKLQQSIPKIMAPHPLRNVIKKNKNDILVSGNHLQSSSKNARQQFNQTAIEILPKLYCQQVYKYSYSPRHRYL